MSKRLLAVAVTTALAFLCHEADAKKWHLVSEKSPVEAEFVDLADGEVVLKRPDGQIIRVPLGKLSQPDRDIARALAASKEDLGEEDRLPVPEMPAIEPNVDPGELRLQNEASLCWAAPKLPGLRAWTVEITTPRGKEMPMPAVSLLSPDGLRRAMGGQDGIVRIDEDKTGQLVQAFVCPELPITALAWSPDSRMLAVGSRRGFLRLWDVATGRLLRVAKFAGDPNVYTTRVAWSPNGTGLAIVLSQSRNSYHFESVHSGTIRVLDLPDLVERKLPATLFFAGTYRADDVAWSPDGAQLATTSAEQGSWVWRLDGRSAPRSLNQADGRPVWSLAIDWSPDGGWIAAQTRDLVRLWDARTLALVYELELKNSHLGKPRWYGKGQRVVLRERKAEIVIDLTSGALKERLSLESHRRYDCERKTFSVVGSTPQNPRRSEAAPAALGQWSGVDKLTVCSDIDGTLFNPPRLAVSIAPDGHWNGSPGMERNLVYIALTEDGRQLTLSPDEFSKKYGWKNDPQRAGTTTGKPPAGVTPDTAIPVLFSPTRVEFKETPLTEVAAYLGKQHNIKISLDAQALSQAGVQEKTPVTLRTENRVSLGWVLLLLTRQTGTACVVGDDSLIFTSREKAIQLGRFLAWPSDPNGKGALRLPATQWELNLERAVDQGLTQLEFVKTPIHDVAEYLSDLQMVAILFDRKALLEKGIDPAKSVITCNLKEITLRTGLFMVLRQHNLACVQCGGFLLITTREAAKELGPTLRLTVGRITTLEIDKDNPPRYNDQGDIAVRRLVSELKRVKPSSTTNWTGKSLAEFLQSLEKERITVLVDSKSLADAGIDLNSTLKSTLPNGVSYGEVLLQAAKEHRLALWAVTQSGARVPLLVTAAPVEKTAKPREN